jgi:hypothetical protein
LADTSKSNQSPDDWGSLGTILEAALAFGVLMAVLIAIGNTQAGWPIALGIVSLAFLYHLLNHAQSLDNLSQWLSSKVA